MNMSMKKDDIIKNNLLFNEDFIGYGMEDNEFGFQIMNAGFQKNRIFKNGLKKAFFT